MQKRAVSMVADHGGFKSKGQWRRGAAGPVLLGGKGQKWAQSWRRYGAKVFSVLKMGPQWES